MVDSKPSRTSLVANPTYNVIILSGCLTASILTALAAYNKYLRQYKTALEIPKQVFHKRWLYGKVTAVGDGDNFRFFHTPGGVLGGWGLIRAVPALLENDTTIPKTVRKSTSKMWSLPFSFSNRRKMTEKKISKHYMDLKVPYKGKRSLPTLSVRLCGIDAPERAHFGNAAPVSYTHLDVYKRQLQNQSL